MALRVEHEARTTLSPMRQAPTPRPVSMLRVIAATASTRKIVAQLLGWSVGLGLLGWIIYRAVLSGDWEKLAAADPLLIAALLGCTAISAVINGTGFWISIQSIRHVRWTDMQLLNLVGNMLNYAPIRLGALARVAYHHRVDRLGLLQIGAWFALIVYILFLGVGACLVATLVHDTFDIVWIAIVVGIMVMGGIATQAVVAHPLIVKHGRGIDRMTRDHRALWGLVALRLADIAAFTARMAVALYILDIHLPLTHIVVLAVVALAAGLIPFGKVGFREFCVAIVAARLAASTDEVELPWEQLALIESAGEALVFIPAGIFALLWYRKRWREAGAS